MFALFALVVGVATAAMCAVMALMMVMALVGGRDMFTEQTRTASYVTMALAFATLAFHFMV